jgi:mannose-6-phosphate isomerase-like protein (cupin superfamily)
MRTTANGRACAKTTSQNVAMWSGIDGTPSRVAPGASVFIPGGATHSVRSSGVADLCFAYVLAADGSDDVDYVFGE